MNLSIQNLVLNYSYKSVLKNLSAEFPEGKIHGLLGENGAGKSTLAKIISGELNPDSGSISCNDYLIYPSKNYSVKNSIEHGICYVHQRPLLAENASIYENLIIGLKKIDKKRINQLLKIWMPQYSTSTLIKDIGGDCNFFTALICALLKNPKILILDEPCALLNEEQVSFLYSKLQELKLQGLNIIVITHSRKEAELYCDTITRLEDGKVVFYSEQQNTENQIDQWGQPSIKNPDSESKISQNEHISNTKKLTINFSKLDCHPVNKPGISNIDFSAMGGEITLISGLADNGLETLEDVITGMENSKFSGTIRITGQQEDGIFRKFARNIKKTNFNTHILRNKTGFQIGIIPSNKNFRATNPNLTIKQMLSCSALSPEELIKRAEINISPSEKVSSLSGGMLQRLILQRELSLNPEILIFCEPLQGLDFVSSQKICHELIEISEQGKLVLILSSSEFPNEICKNKYELIAGRLCMVEK